MEEDDEDEGKSPTSNSASGWSVMMHDTNSGRGWQNSPAAGHNNDFTPDLSDSSSDIDSGMPHNNMPPTSPPVEQLQKLPFAHQAD